jgi:uncharacterized protein YndB with AHSA1/START domain
MAGAEARTVDGDEARAVVLARTYKTDLEDLWDARTNPERIPRWFLPVSGDLRTERGGGGRGHRSRHGARLGGANDRLLHGGATAS